MLDLNRRLEAQVLLFQPLQAARVFKGMPKMAPNELANSRWSA
jgi:hypothetical protein